MRPHRAGIGAFSAVDRGLAEPGLLAHVLVSTYADHQPIYRKSNTAAAIRYALSRWTALTRYVDDGHLEIDNNAADRALRGIALGRKNFLFAGSDSGGQRAAAIYSPLGSAKLNGIDPEIYLQHVLEHIADHPARTIDELLAWNVSVTTQTEPS